eukprot:CAMPEP_0194027172 /NCGR_PEP_ID=MMETSP0009_2-20130614/1371_1 /TAXON_ID=210454 /ORGANISM="Grammatophora oceanica, Strain CCMP 410" /LENGTH=200 /DNA_ID=CAMNT_0038666139 /DNA_START=200 /DNA_END=803 /DNA_ORIENTATION=+
MTERTPLTNAYKNQLRLYDPESTIAIPTDVLQGYLILLNPDNHADPDTNLSFAALTDGNVVDACFDAHHQRQGSPAYRASRAAKGSLAAASDSSEGVSKLAVETYRNAFRIVLGHQDRLRKTFVLVRCCGEGECEEGYFENWKSALPLSPRLSSRPRGRRLDEVREKALHGIWSGEAHEFLLQNLLAMELLQLYSCTEFG